MSTELILQLSGLLLALLAIVLAWKAWRKPQPAVNPEAETKDHFIQVRTTIRARRGELRLPAIDFFKSVLKNYQLDRPVTEELCIEDIEHSYLIRLGYNIPVINIHEVKLEMVTPGNKANTQLIETRRLQKEASSRSLPINISDKKFDSMVAAIKAIEKPPEDKFDNRCVYRFLSFEFKDNVLVLRFDKSDQFRYFDQLNFNNLLEYELGNAYFGKNIKNPKAADLPFRKYAIKRLIENNFCDFSDLTLFAGISTLTLLKVNEEQFRVLMHKRKGTATVPGAFHLIPAGEFQPINSNPNIFKKDFHIWHSILREYSEEIQLNPEAKGVHADSFSYQEDNFRVISENIPEGDRYFLGFGLDPITFKVEVLTCVVLDFDKFISTLPGATITEKKIFFKNLKKNSEGELFWHAGEIGVAYEEIDDFINDGTTLNAARMALTILKENHNFFKEKYLTKKDPTNGYA